jgi:hypothetical protein
MQFDLVVFIVYCILSNYYEQEQQLLLLLLLLIAPRSMKQDKR